MIRRVRAAVVDFFVRETLKSRLRMNRVPFWPWDSAAKLRERLEWATMHGYPSPNADRRWLESHEGKIAMLELSLMRALRMTR